jgi:genome maintenance exonuclease 1
MSSKYINGLRHYECNNQWYPSVTSILSATKSDEEKESLKRWRLKVGKAEADRISAEACSRGSEMHSLCEKLFKGEELGEISDFALPVWHSIRPLLARVHPIMLEEFVYHESLKYAGRFDCFGSFDGCHHTMIDFKTSTKPKRKEWIEGYFVQAVAYAGALYSLTGQQVDSVVILIATPGRLAQSFVIDRAEMLDYWAAWKQRLKYFEEINRNS